MVFISLSFVKLNAQTYGAGGGSTTGTNNTNIGASSGSLSATGNYNNVSVGANSGNDLSTSGENTYVGYGTGGAGVASSGSWGGRNSFFGHEAGNKNSTGAYNLGLGYKAMFNNTSGSYNISLGFDSMNANLSASDVIAIGQSTLTQITNTTSSYNVAIGRSAGRYLSTGEKNVFLGFTPASVLQIGSANIFIGSQSGQTLTKGSNNIIIGSNSGYNLNSTISQDFNTLIGYQSGYNLSSGISNTFIGAVTVDSGTSSSTLAGNNTSNTVIIGDGSGNQRFFAHSNGNVGLGLPANNIPQNRLEINSTPLTQGLVANTMGLRFRGINNPNFNPSSSSTRKVLSVNTSGDVILVDDIGGGITSTCTTNFQIPVGNSLGNLSCSQISDNGTTVGIGSTGTVSYTSYAGFELGSTLPSSTGDFKLNVEGVVRSLAYFAYSDKKFKKDIKSIENALTTIEKLEGKTYVWNREAFKVKNFDSGGHSGFIAQDLEKVLPHLVATDKDGDKSVNYTELIPYLVEAIKEQNSLIKDQQNQIDELKNQISDNFKAQNNELIQLENTKIISVSPNPSNDLISVSLNIEKSVQTASLQVHDLNGKLLNNLTISDRENNITRTLQKDNFGAGVYIVSLVVNGKSIDSKKVVFN